MSLPAPNLDNRKFQDLVDDAKLQIARKCPEWTEHNVSDPGVTLIELFAMMTETMLYQMNQVPERNYVKFLEMLGVSLLPPTPARVNLRFHLSRFIEEGERLTLSAYKIVAGTVRTSTTEAVEFCTETDLHMTLPRLKHILALPGETSWIPDSLQSVAADAQPQNDAEMPPDGASEIAQESPPLPEGARPFLPKSEFKIFNDVPMEEDALYLGFEADISNNLIELAIDGISAEATQRHRDYPLHQWQVWNSAEKYWQALTPVWDTTQGFSRSTTDTDEEETDDDEPGKTPTEKHPPGRLQLELPNGLQPSVVARRTAYWTRCVYLYDLKALPLRAGEKKTLRQGEERIPYDRSPLIRSLTATTVGGTALACQCTRVEQTELGQSNGQPGQVFSIGHAPVLALAPEEHLRIGAAGAPDSEQEIWTLVNDFAESGPRDRHFVCDNFAGEIRFGPSIAQTNGTMRQYGAVPARAKTITLTAFRYGGGMRGNVLEKEITVLKSSVPYVATVVNPRPAIGGKEQETLEAAKIRARSLLRRNGRAVTARDFEEMAREDASPGDVGRALCVHPIRPQTEGEDTDYPPSGTVQVLLVPSLDDNIRVPRAIHLRVPEYIKERVKTYLRERCLLTTQLIIGEPDYVYLSTEIELVANPDSNPEHVRQAVEERLNHYIHPLTGGPEEQGWPSNRALRLSDIYAQVHLATGVAFLLSVKMFRSSVNVDGTFETAIPVNNIETEGLRLGRRELLCTRRHRITVKPMWALEDQKTLA